MVNPSPGPASDFVGGAGAGVVRELMGRDVQHVGTALEHVLRAVPMMHVVVDDGHALRAQRAGVGGRNGDVVVDAEPHGPGALGMMAGRTHQRDRLQMRFPHDPLNRIDGRSRREPGDLGGFGRGVRVRIEHGRAAGGSGNALEIGRVVHAGELLVGRERRGHDLAALPPPFVRDHVHHVGALGALRMPGRRLMLGKSFGRDQDERHC